MERRQLIAGGLATTLLPSPITPVQARPLASPQARSLQLGNAATVKHKLMMVVPQCYYRDATLAINAQYGRDWADLWRDFNWPGWIKPQADLAFKYGANGLKSFCGPLNGDWGPFPSASVLATRIRQLADYVRQQTGGGFYLTLFRPADVSGQPDNRAFADNGSINSAVQTAMQVILPILETIPNMIGVDLVNEVQGGSSAAWGGTPGAAYEASISAMFALARSIAPSLPYTISVYVDQSALAWNSDWIRIVSKYADYVDVHPYSGGGATYANGLPDVTHAQALTNSSWFPGRFFMGEVGVNQSVAANTQTAFVAGLGGITQMPQCSGGCLFSAADFDVTNSSARWGVSDETVQNPRTAKLIPYINAWASAL